MIEKIVGCTLISKLRSIHLMECDFNFANKAIYGMRMMDNVRNYNLMPEEIFTERNRTADDGTLTKVLICDISLQARCHDTVTPIMFFYLWTEGPVEGYVSELSEILEMAWRQGLRQGDDQLPRTVLLPAINLKRSIPLVKGANMHGFAQNLPNHVQNAR